jgi:hypothetical protein
MKKIMVLKEKLLYLPLPCILHCYSLDVKCPPKEEYSWFPEYHYWEAVKPLRSGAEWRSLGHSGHALEEDF